MDLELNEDQQMLVDSVERLAAPYAELSIDRRRGYHCYSAGLFAELDDAGFLDIAKTEGYSALEAALMVERLSRLPVTIEMGASSVVAPMLVNDVLPRPLVLISGDIASPQRFLPQAKAALAIYEDNVVFIEIDPSNIEVVDSILAYPYGKFISTPDLSKCSVLDNCSPQAFLTWGRIALAVEGCGTVRAAIDFTVDYVKQRRLFGKALGSFQAVQHRLAQCHTLSEGATMLAFHAAATGDPLLASLAASNVQMHIAKVAFDLHQFNGGMGMTNEHTLHFWTMRLRGLQSEFGGASKASMDAAELMWPEDSKPPMFN